ncbi:MAG: hypothetical protein F6K54_31010 [Okeania sp. SIO3B5]|uniref:hypothetical protein n=1 Tax=Okeania sp. SIO3B5 TaxID=2607811 RepID=UPI0013FF8E35|nr:hypothetical protein [Okeania sp. SIO3B5]NEO57115.1 hypothetical protein [Okeania sp. SIO3B5]
MNNEQPKLFSERLLKSINKAIAEALERHRKLGESIAIWEDGKVVIVPPEKIPLILDKQWDG